MHRLHTVLGLSLLCSVGCSQLLGLEDTKFDQRDAMTDAPSNCDAAPRCTSTTGRSVCGQLFGTGDTAGQPLRVSSPTGDLCSNLNSTMGPCAFQVYGQSTQSYYTFNAVDRIQGEVDDCGRFVVPDLDATATNVVVVATSVDFVETSSAVLGREATAGTDRDVRLPVVSSATAMAWGTQLDGTNPPDVGGGLLVYYVNAQKDPLATEELRVNGGGVNAPTTQPWGAYFTGSEPFGAIDTTLMSTQSNGSALVVPAAGTFQLGGFRPGKNCPPVSMQSKSGALIHVTLSC